jgi:hypothetical protein
VENTNPGHSALDFSIKKVTFTIDSLSRVVILEKRLENHQKKIIPS